MSKPQTSHVARLMAAFLLVSTIPALANPQGGSVGGGSATISQNGSTLNVNQTSDRALINWNSFNIAAGETTNFVQPSSSSIAVNRVNSASASSIFGNLNANGNLVIINQNGVLFGAGAKVNVNGLVATTADIDTNQFMAGGNLQFTKPGNPNASVINNGQITAKQAGLVGLVAPNVINNGVITAQLGKVQLSSGDTTTIDMYGDHLMEVAVSDAVKSQLVSNSGIIEADGGTIALTAAAGGAIVNSLITVAGELHAPAVGQTGGDILIYAEGSHAVQGNVTALKDQRQGASTVKVTGLLDVSGKSKSQTGGSVTVAADNVALMAGSVIDVSGDAGGGAVKIGGDFHGAGTTPDALHSIMQSGAVVNADALSFGNGGTVAFWADDWSNFGGMISARGGAQGGNGGFVETSGKKTLSATGLVDARAPFGHAGTWLLDPNNITIQAAGSDTNMTGNPNFSSTDDNAIVTTGSLETALNQGTSVSITTASAGNNSQAGTITVADNISKTAGGDATLSLIAQNNIIVNDNVFITSTSGKLNLVFDADSQSAGAGSITLGNGAALHSNGGNITLGGGSNPTTGYAIDYTTNCCGGNAGILLMSSATTVDAAGGNIVMNGRSNEVYDNSRGIVSYGVIETSGSGTITLNGIGGTSGSGNNYDIFLNGPNSGAGLIAANPNLITLNSLGTNPNQNGLYLNNSNTNANNGALDYYQVIGWTTTLDSGLWLGSVTKASGGDETWTIAAPGNITFLSNSTVSSTSGKLNLVVDPDSTDGGSGSIMLQSGASLHSNGGNITLSGGSNPSTGYAIDFTNNCCGGRAGITLASSASTVDAGGGNIVMRGRSNEVYDNSSGIYSNGVIETSGSGTITLTGIGGTSGGGNNLDIFLNGPNNGAGLIAANPNLITLNSLGTNPNQNGLWTNDSAGALDYYQVINWNKTLDSAWFLGSVLKASGGDETWTIAAPGSITFLSNSTVSSTSGKLNLVVDPDSTDGGAGSIMLQSGASLVSNGGNITLSGGSNPTTGYAIDFTNNCCGGRAGITLASSASTVDAGGGNIVMRGRSTEVYDNESGIYSNGVIETSGSGTITLNGIGGTSGGGNNYDIFLNGPNSGAGLIAANPNLITLNSLGTNPNQNGLYLNNSNTNANNGALDYYQVIGWTTTLDSGLWLGSVTKASGGDETWTIAAPGNITFLSNAQIASTSGKLNLVVDPDSTDGGSGSIMLQSGASLHSNGGNITLSGGSNPTTGYAIDFTNNCCGSRAGITLASSASTIDAGGGNIVMRGRSNEVWDNSSGIYSNGVIETSGSGTITLTGVGGPSTGGNNYDIFLNGPNSGAGLIAANPNLITLNSLGTNPNQNGLYLNNSNTNANNGALDYYQVIGWTTTLDSGLWLGSVTKASGGDETWTIAAPGNITFLSNSTVSSTSGKLNLVVDPDSTDGGAGSIMLQSGASLVSNGGNITLSGGSNPTTGYAIDFTNNCCGGHAGITLASSASTVDAGGGNIVMRGRSNEVYDNSSGIYSNGVIETSGSGTITLTGVGGPSTGGNNYDIFLNGPNSSAGLIAANPHLITLNSLGVYVHNNGLYLNNSNINADNGNLDFYAVTGWATTTNANLWLGSVLKQTGGDANWTIAAGGNITFLSNAQIASTSGKLNITVDANDANAGAGYIYVGSGAGLYSNGGNITLGGGSDPTSGFAIADTANCCGGNAGIMLASSSTVINAAGGNILMRGQNSEVWNNSSGIYDNGTIETSGTGSITMAGRGALSTGQNDYDIFLNNSASITTNGSGAISLTAAGAGLNDGIASNTSGSYLIGGNSTTGNISIASDILEFNGITVKTSGGVTYAPFSTNATVGVAGGSGTLQVTNNLLAATTASALTLGNTTAGAMNVDAYSWLTPLTLINGNGPMTIAQNQSMNGHNLTLETNDLVLSANVASNGGGLLTIAPSDLSTAFHVNDGTSTGLYIDGTGLTHLGSGWSEAIFGNTQSSQAVTVGATSWLYPVVFQTGSGTVEFTGAQNLGTRSLLATTTTGNIVLDQDSSVTSTASSGNSIVLASGGHFINNDTDDGSLALAPGSGSARFLVYSTDPSLDTVGALGSNASHVFNETYANYGPSSVTASGNTFIYSLAPTLFVTATNMSRLYGSNNPTFTYNVTGFLDGDTSSIISGSPLLSSNANLFSGVGNYAIMVALNSFTNSAGYTVVLQNGALTVTPAPLTVTADNKSITYGNPDVGLTYHYTGLVAGDAVANFTGGLSRTGDSSVGVDSILENTLASTGNYRIGTYNAGTYTINSAPVAAPPAPPPPPVVVSPSVQSIVNNIVNSIHVATNPIIVTPTVSYSSAPSATIVSQNSSEGSGPSFGSSGLSSSSTSSNSSASTSSSGGSSGSSSTSGNGDQTASSTTNSGTGGTNSSVLQVTQNGQDATTSNSPSTQKPAFNILDLSSTTRQGAPSVVWENKQSLKFNIPTVCYTINNLYITCTRQKTG